MQIGQALIVVLGIFFIFGIGYKSYSLFYLKSVSGALLCGLILMGTVLPIMVLSNEISISIGGFIIPQLYLLYLYIRMRNNHERKRALVASALVTVALYIAFYLMPEEVEFYINPAMIIAPVAALFAFAIANTRASVLFATGAGIFFTRIIKHFEMNVQDKASTLALGSEQDVNTWMVGLFVVLFLGVVIDFMHEQSLRRKRKRCAQILNEDQVT